MTLTEDEVRRITRRKQATAQMRQLNAMGIKFTQRADGSLAVSEAHALEVLGGGALNSEETKQPKWDMANA